MTWSTNAESDTVMTMFPIANILFVPAWGTKVNTKVETSFGGKSETDNIALELNRRDTPCGKEGEDTVTLTVAFDCEVGVKNNADAESLKRSMSHKWRSVEGYNTYETEKHLGNDVPCCRIWTCRKCACIWGGRLP
jgi:hypothetical protein